MARKKILIVEDDEKERELISEIFPAEEFLLSVVPTGEKLLECIFDWHPDLVLLDMRLPGVQGLQVLQLIRSDERTQNVPVMVVSALDSQKNIVSALKSGADEYVTKPYGSMELLWKVRALLRRLKEGLGVLGEKEISAGMIRLNLEDYKAFVKGKPLRLTNKEFALLETFMRHIDKVVKRTFLLETLWGFDSSVNTRTVDWHVSTLRRKLGRAGRYIQTVREIGYYFGIHPR